MQSLLIIGRGVFGVSAALAAAGDYQVALIGSDEEGSASWGPGRICRSIYPREPYTGLAQKAKGFWDAKEFFHNTTRLVHEPDGSITVDQEAGWIEAAKAMKEALREAKERGVNVVDDTVDSLLWTGSRCIGAKTASATFTADTVLLALGSRLPSFLAAEGRPIDDICAVVLIPWMLVQLDDSKYETLKDSPIVVYPGKGEYLPPNDQKRLWVNNARSASVRNNSKVGKTQSAESPYYQETLALSQDLLGSAFCKTQVVSFSYCLDCISPSQDFIIGPVPDSQGLYVAGAGSLHAFKMLPVIGQEIIPILKGRTTEHSDLWSIEGHRAKVAPGPVHGEVMPERIYCEE